MLHQADIKIGQKIFLPEFGVGIVIGLDNGLIMVNYDGAGALEDDLESMNARGARLADAHLATTNAMRRMLDASATPESMMVMSMASNAQECIVHGMYAEAVIILNEIKAVVELSLGERDEHGRHVKTGVRYE